MTRGGRLSDSIIFIGGPGLGKTTLARLAASDITETVGGGLSSVSKAHEMFMKLQSGAVKSTCLFIDEIHSARKGALEAIYSAMEDGVIHSQLYGAIDVSSIQIVAATTEPGKCPRPLLERFGAIIYLEFYSIEELTTILTRSVDVLKAKASLEFLADIAQRSRGTPRRANKLLRRASDLAINDNVTQLVLDELWSIFEIDDRGLERIDRNVLSLVGSQTRPIGLNNIARRLSMDTHTIENMVEPYLMQLGFLEIVPGGRAITLEGVKHLASGDLTEDL